MKRFLILFFLSSVLISCKEENLPKPKAFLALNYPEAVYSEYKPDCSYSFEINNLSRVAPARNNVSCWLNINYPLLDATVFITYQQVNNNIDSLLMDAQKLPLQHTIKADFIEGDVYTNEQNKTYGMFYEVDGDAASQAQFYVTDSVKHFITGSLYFNEKPNFDSIMLSCILS
ncbi:gliding motility lipoprotein GldD [Antarcticibacterium sp. 1MA-6-2]|uniref:gliding motility lipoprotein GldD n=1 Tax=Antarcticibacterium sp. 1MA-6-2 TaxID=2908210 RepID=UPI0028833791|nr:gliding motility lipoprotein GldD [Antarcticibacterium sp. 1MA-6-2]